MTTPKMIGNRVKNNSSRDFLAIKYICIYINQSTKDSQDYNLNKSYADCLNISQNKFNFLSMLMAAALPRTIYKNSTTSSDIPL